MSKKRLLVKGRSAVYHVMSRTVRKQFWLDEREREVFIRQMRKQAEFAGVEVLAFCLMANHFHMLLRVLECPYAETGEHLIDDAELLRRYEVYYGEEGPQSAYSLDELRAILETGGESAEAARRAVLRRMGDLPAFMRELKQRFVFWFNHEHGNEGTIWSARYKSILVEDTPAILTRLAAYIDLNPVRAGIVKDPADYRWCSYAEAMAGREGAGRGLCGLFHAKANEVKAVLRAYRLILFGSGSMVKTGKGRIPAEYAQIVSQKAGAVTFAETLRRRVSYFSRGVALGHGEFYENLCQSGAVGKDGAQTRRRFRRALPWEYIERCLTERDVAE